MAKTRGKLKLVAGLLATALIFGLAWPVWLPWFGTYLEETDSLERADAIVVLAGDWTGNRILRAAQLANEQYAPVVIVSGPMLLYGMNEADIAIEYAVRHGYPKRMFVPMYGGAHSTREEAQLVLPFLRARQVQKALIVTSAFHTRRARRVYRSLRPAVSVRVIGAPYGNAPLNRWWTTRPAQKMVFTEWQKTVADWAGI